ncbi:unnamed protein product [Brassica oleracea var. botrytis]
MPVRVVESNAPAQVSGSDPGNRSPLPRSSLLAAGQAFSGTQNVSNQQKEEAWRVNVQIQGVDLEHGYLCGTMEALNVPMADTPVITFWEGEIVDGKNYTFYTGKWEATREDDMRHWSKFPSFAPLQGQVESDGGRQLDLSNYPYIFMRWKEQYFVNVGTDCGLTIAGFYYVCFSCSDGSISGFYYDPNSSPFQKLELKTVNEGSFHHMISSKNVLKMEAVDEVSKKRKFQIDRSELSLLPLSKHACFDKAAFSDNTNGRSELNSEGSVSCVNSTSMECENEIEMKEESSGSCGEDKISFETHLDFIYGTQNLEDFSDKDIENILYLDDEEEEDEANGCSNAAKYVLSSGRWTVDQDSTQDGTKKPTIDQEFEQYFSTLML